VATPSAAWITRCPERLDTGAFVRDTDRDSVRKLVLNQPETVDERRGTRRGYGDKPAHAIVAPVEQGSRHELRNSLLECIVCGRNRKHKVAPVEVAVQTARALLDQRTTIASNELLEEILDRVLFGEPLDQLDLLDRHGRLICDGAREIDLRGPFGDEHAEQFIAGDQRNGDGRPAAACRQLRAKLGKRDRRPCAG
jgi:hypothetical protein